MSLKVYRVWIEPYTGEACCVLVAAPTEEKAIELAKAETSGFGQLESAFLAGAVRVQEFDTATERASIC